MKLKLYANIYINTLKFHKNYTVFFCGRSTKTVFFINSKNVIFSRRLVTKMFHENYIVSPTLLLFVSSHKIKVESPASFERKIILIAVNKRPRICS